MNALYASAVLSPCGTYRYELERGIQANGQTVAFIAVNPSKADAHREDMSTKKFWGFASRWGCRRYILGNAFAFRSTQVKLLPYWGDAVGPDNDAHLVSILARADFVVPCWGSRLKLAPPLRARLERVTRLIRASGKPALALGFTDSGDPKHPLMLSYSTKLELWGHAQ
jgi:hypothetical protein